MGGIPSKAGRKLPKQPQAPTTKIRTPQSFEQPSDRLASRVKNQEVVKDAGDPHFLANLNRLGPVQVDDYMQTIRPRASSANSQFFKSRESENQASSLFSVRNRLHASYLSEMFDKRKDARSIQDVERLAKQYGIDTTKLENLARFVSSPSVKNGSATRTVGEDGQENVRMTAVWVEPRL